MQATHVSRLGWSHEGTRQRKLMHGCALAFIGLEVVRHVVLMRLSMGAYHVVSGILSIGLALLIVKLGIDAVRQRERELRWSDRVARVMAASTMVSAEVGDPVSGLAAQARFLLNALGGRTTREEFEQLKEIAQRSENVEKVLRSLAFALSGYEPPKGRV